jgi:stage II sporulation protein M
VNKLFKTIYEDIKRNKNIYISIILVMIISLIFGTLFITILNDSDKLLVTNQINEFFKNIADNKYIANENLVNNLLNNNVYGIVLWIIGISIIGIPVIICMFFYKGFVLAFTISSLIYNFKVEGVFLSFIYVFPHMIISLIVYFILTYYSFHLSIKLLRKILNKEDFKLKFYIRKYIFILLLSVITLSLCSLYETYVVPYLLKLIY